MSGGRIDARKRGRCECVCGSVSSAAHSFLVAVPLCVEQSVELIDWLKTLGVQECIVFQMKLCCGRLFYCSCGQPLHSYKLTMQGKGILYIF